MQGGIYSQKQSRPSFWAYSRNLLGAISMILEILEPKWMVIYKYMHFLASNQSCCKVFAMSWLIWRILTVQEADDFDPASVLWIKLLLLLANPFPVAHAISKLHVSEKSMLAAKFFASDSQLSASAFDLSLHDFNGKQLFVESIASSASAFAQGDFHLHGFVQSISALSSGETIGHQPPMFSHCTAMHSTQHGNGLSMISKCSKFFKAPNLINHVLSYPMHVE